MAVHLYMLDWDDPEEVEYAMKVIAMMRREGFPLQQFYVAPPPFRESKLE